MPRTRDAELHEATRTRILDTARRQMAENGTAGVGLRAIARELDVSAPAIYRYFASLDELITALIVDAFTALAVALETARDQAAAKSTWEQLVDVLLAYRGWAVAHPIDFQLIYGNPIPGYVAPREVTVPLVVRGFAVIVGLLAEMLQSGSYKPRPPYDAVPEPIGSHVREMIARDEYPISEIPFYMGVVGWTQLHGVIMLELYNHLGPTIGNVDVYYRAQIDNLLMTMMTSA